MNNSGSSSSSITALVPGGVVTTQNISTVIKPKENNNSMQFVKIQTPELSKKAVEQIRVAQESKITKDKIKEVEEEWQSNLLNWKSKRRQQFVGVHPSKSDQIQEEQNNNDANNENGRKIKTFAEMIEQRAKAGNRLNFHLERYIGSSEDDNPEEDEDDNLSQANEHDQNGREIENNNNINDSNNVSSNATLDDDGDRLPIGGEDVVDRSAQQSQHSNKIIISNSKLIQKEKIAYINDIVSDNSVNINNNKNVPNVGANGAGDSFVNKNGVKLHSQEDVGREKVESDVDDDDDYEEQYSEQRPINSTFIKGIEQPPTPPTIHSNVSIKPPLDGSATKRQVSLTDNARFDSVSEEEEHEEEEEEDEEEDEEEEEQKQLQRIAFVQKLKAFEKMTKPSLQEPRLVPTRAAKPQPPAPPPPPPPPQPVATRCSPVISQPPPASICSSQSQSRLPSVKEVQPPPPPPMPRPKLQHRAETTQVSPVPRPPPQPHPPAQTIQRVVEPKPDLPSPVPAPIPSTISSKTTIPQPPPPPRARPRTPSPPAPPRQPTTRQQTIAPTLTPPIAPISPPQRQKHQAPQPQQPVTSRQQPLGQQQQQTPPLSSREEKSQDRTVLSVSGKKRCSSCKEELGRGAAAFVIESLNLVYHTNCFRCSVCHVNLSNGFRGVDVRVHAGALHCQNCYSKDGLNYSRV